MLACVASVASVASRGPARLFLVCLPLVCFRPHSGAATMIRGGFFTVCARVFSRRSFRGFSVTLAQRYKYFKNILATPYSNTRVYLRLSRTTVYLIFTPIYIRKQVTIHREQFYVDLSIAKSTVRAKSLFESRISSYLICPPPIGMPRRPHLLPPWRPRCIWFKRELAVWYTSLML